MPFYPGAINMLVPQGTPGNPAQQSRIVARGIIVHTNASNTSIERLHNLYMPGSGYGGGEAHFQLETGVSPGSHRLAQYVDTSIRADNNYRANSFTLPGDSTLYGYLSIESGDLGQPYEKTFTDLGQREQLEDLLVWMCQTHNIPPVQCSSPTAPGIGWHAMWGYNTPCPTGSGTYGVFTAPDGRRGCLNNPWTNTFGKICPGPGKISEMPDIIAAVKARIEGDDDMGQPFSFWQVGTQVYAVAADLQGKLPLSGHALDFWKGLVAFTGGDATIHPVAAADVTAFSIIPDSAAVLAQVTSANVHATSADTKVTDDATATAVAALETHLKTQDTAATAQTGLINTVNTNVLKIPTTGLPPDMTKVKGHIDSLPGDIGFTQT